MAYTDEDKKNHIREVQDYLRTIARHNENIPTIVPTGVYDEGTGEAVRQFQREYGLPVTGTVDLDTWRTIVEVYLAAEEYFSEGAAIMPFPGSDYSMSEGDRGNPIYILQAVLNTVSEQYSNTPVIPVDGVYGSATADAVRRMQDVVGEKRTGAVDYKTWNKLARLYNYHVMAGNGKE